MASVSSNFVMWYWIIVGIIALFALLIHAGIDNCGVFDIEEFFDTFFGEFGWVTLLVVFALGGIVYAFIVWIWWAMLLIILGVLLIPLIIFLIFFIIDAVSNDDEENEEDEDEDDDENNEKKRNYNKNIKNEKIYNTSSSKKSSSTITNKITFDSIAGLETAKTAFREKVILPFEHPELFEKFGKKAGGGILLYGLPGTGKTMFAEAASNELNATFISIKCSDIKSKWYGESEQNVKAIFNKAKKSERAIIFFDEFEAIGAKRTDNGNNGNNDLVPEILAEMQGVGSSKIKSTIMIIAATNKPWAIDSAFMRPGRFDEKIYIPLPDYEARRALFEIQLKKLPLSNDLDFDYLANITDGFNGADIKEVCEKLKMSAINDSIEKGVEQTIGMDDVKKIEKDIKSSVSQEDIKQLEKFEEGLR